MQPLTGHLQLPWSHMVIAGHGQVTLAAAHSTSVPSKQQEQGSVVVALQVQEARRICPHTPRCCTNLLCVLSLRQRLCDPKCFMTSQWRSSHQRSRRRYSTADIRALVP